MFGTVQSYNASTGALVMTSSGTPVGSGTFTSWNISISGSPGANGAGTGTVTSMSVVTANGVSGSVANSTSTPAVTLTLGAITPSSVAATGNVSAGGALSATGNVSGGNLSGSNSGDVTVGTFGSSPTANGISISSQAITLQPADATHPGAVSTGTQTIAGTKTFSSTISGSVNGNAATATALQNARTINGVSFNGTANVTVPAAAGTLTGSALASGVTASSLVTLGTLTDVTTNNVSTSAHGFAPKLPGDNTKFLDGTGAYSVPAANAVFSKSFTSPDETITASGSFTLAHGLGASPTLIATYLICQNADRGYSPGDILYYNTGVSLANDVSRGHIITADSSNIYVFYGSDSATYNILNKSTLSTTSINNVNWKLRVMVWA